VGRAVRARERAGMTFLRDALGFLLVLACSATVWLIAALLVEQ